jgi:hypothetical protein
MTKHERRRQFKTPQQLNRAIAEAAQLLIAQVRARVSSSLIARITIDDRFVSVSFVDYPDDFLDLVEWRAR